MLVGGNAVYLIRQLTTDIQNNDNRNTRIFTKREDVS